MTSNYRNYCIWLGSRGNQFFTQSRVQNVISAWTGRKERANKAVKKAARPWLAEQGKRGESEASAKRKLRAREGSAILFGIF